MLDDTYKTILQESKGYYCEKNSKFISFASPVKNEKEVKERLAEIKKNYYDARHCCYAYILGYDKSIYRTNDDGEPSGTAGKPLYGQLLSHDITNTLIVVIRYFGGTKLGVPGLINAYKTAALDAINNNKIIEKFVEIFFLISFDFEKMNSVMQILKKDNVKIVNQNFVEKYQISFYVRKRDAEKIVESLEKIKSLEVVKHEEP